MKKGKWDLSWFGTFRDLDMQCSSCCNHIDLDLTSSTTNASKMVSVTTNKQSGLKRGCIHNKSWSQGEGRKGGSRPLCSEGIDAVGMAMLAGNGEVQDS
jgi:hypothetical protein